MKLALITEAWHPQVNGVVRTWTNVVRELQEMGHIVEVIHPGLFRTCRAPKYPEIRLAMFPYARLRRLLDEIAPEAIHIATEGPLGLAGRRYCRRRGWPFTTSYHTQYPAYLKAYFGVPPGLTYRLLRWFHGRAQGVLVPTATVQKELAQRGLGNTVLWNRGVDARLFCPGSKDVLNLSRPIFVTAGRVAVEKNIEAFLRLDLPGSKVVIGDGPARARLQRAYPQAHWTGYLHGADLAKHYAAADVFVFPSRTDTFGVVMLEANACGLPVAAFPVTGPVDVVKPGISGVLDEDLRTACLGALRIDPAGARAYALLHSWTRCARIVLDNLAEIPGRR